MSEQKFRLDLRVGTKWVPATQEPMNEHRLEKLKRAYAIDRPHIRTRVVKVDGELVRRSQRGRR